MIKVGVLITTYNRKQFLMLALGSVLDQTHPELEIIVIDNGSTDGTAELIASVTDPRVRYVVNELNLGMAGSINKGIPFFSKEVEWCTILSDDDLLDRNYLLNLIARFSTSKTKSVIDSHRIFIDEQGKKIREARPSPCEESAFEYLNQRSRNIRETYLTGVLFKRTAFQKIGGYPVFSTGLGSDDAFIFALAMQDQLVFESSAIASIRIHKGAESRSAADGINKLETIKEFISYCFSVAHKFGNITSEQERSFVRTLERYRMNLNSYWWRSAVHAALDQNHDKNNEELTKLRSRVSEDRHAFSRRIRFNVFLEDRTKHNPESCRIYRASGKIIDYILFLVRNRLP